MFTPGSLDGLPLGTSLALCSEDHAHWSSPHLIVTQGEDDRHASYLTPLDERNEDDACDKPIPTLQEPSLHDYHCENDEQAALKQARAHQSRSYPEASAIDAAPVESLHVRLFDHKSYSGSEKAIMKTCYIRRPTSMGTRLLSTQT